MADEETHLLSYESPPPEPDLTCPLCRKPSDSIKRFDVEYRFYFYGAGMRWRDMEYILCPACMRKTILRRMWANVLSANFAWPLLAARCLWQIRRTYKPGHSLGVVAAYARLGAVHLPKRD